MSLCGLPGCSEQAHQGLLTCVFHVGMERFIEPPNLGTGMKQPSVVRCKSTHCECDGRAEFQAAYLRTYYPRVHSGELTAPPIFGRVGSLKFCGQSVGDYEDGDVQRCWVMWQASAALYANHSEQLPTRCNARPNAPEIAPASNARGAGLKYDGDKPRWTLMMGGLAYALSLVVMVLTFGASKYKAHSWRQVENGRERYRDALYRHLAAYEAGEVHDPESGLPHLAHVTTNAMFLLELDKQQEL